MAALMPQGKQQYFTAGGIPLVGGKVYTYAAGTTTPLATYTTAAASTPNANPVILDSRGEASIFFSAANYKIVVKDSLDSTIWTQDNLPGDAAATIVANLAASSGSSLVGYIQAGAGAVALTVQSKLRESIVASAKGFGAVGDNTTDDSAALNAMFVAGAGGTIELEPGKTYKCLSTLTIRGDATKIKGNGATINSYATGSAITFALVGGTRYPVNVDIQDLSIVAYGVGAYAIRTLTSYSTYRRVSIALPIVNVSGRGFALAGDETNGTGPYYNTFINCDVQSASSGTDHIGYSMIAAAPGYRSPNANTWIGGRVGQCLKNYVIKGNGNMLVNPDSENAAGVGTAISFEADTTVNCQQNTVTGAYIENASVAFNFSTNAKDNYIYGGFGTGVTTLKTDSGSGNSFIGAFEAWTAPVGIQFPAVSSNVNALDYYGEGTWTPVATGVTVNSGSPVWTGTYTRIGNTVHAHIKQVGGNITTVAGASYVTLPFTASQGEWGYFGDIGWTIGSGGCATYGNLLYFATALTASVVTASITFRV